MLNVMYAQFHKLAFYAECHYTGCHYAERRGAKKWTSLLRDEQ
jgi:hypothetical protein